MIYRPRIDITPSCVLALDLDNGYLTNTVGSKKVFDHSQYHNHGTVYGAVPRYPGFEFDGTDDYVDCGNNASLNMGTSDFTISLWLKKNKYKLSIPFFKVKHGSSWGGHTEYNGWFLRIEGDNDIKVSIQGGDGGVLVEETFSNKIPDYEWHHIAVVFDRDSVFTLYIDGNDHGSSSSIASVGSVNNNEIVNIGGLTYAGNRYFKGAIDEVRIYNTALTALEVKSNYELSRWRYGK